MSMPVFIGESALFACQARCASRSSSRSRKAAGISPQVVPTNCTQGAFPGFSAEAAIVPQLSWDEIKAVAKGIVGVAWLTYYGQLWGRGCCNKGKFDRCCKKDNPKGWGKPCAWADSSGRVRTNGKRVKNCIERYCEWCWSWK